MSLWNFYFLYVKRRSDGKPKYPYLCLLCVDLKWYSFSFIVRCVFSIRSNSSHFLFHWFCKRSFCAIITILIYWNCLLDTPLNWDSIDTNFRFLKQFQRYLMWLGKDQTRFFYFHSTRAKYFRNELSNSADEAIFCEGCSIFVAFSNFC